MSYHFPFLFVIFTVPLHSTSTLPRCYDVALVSRCPAPHPESRPSEREGVRRLRHSLGCFSTLVPWAEKAPPPLQPLSLRSPDPSSWYSGLCPCLPGTLSFPSPAQFLPHPLPSASPANKLSPFLCFALIWFCFMLFRRNMHCLVHVSSNIYLIQKCALE